LLAPSAFTILACSINRGLKQISPFNPIVCNYQVNASGMAVSISNFDLYNGDGLIILDLTIQNPITAGWTSNWRVTSYL
jgi:hypothetical protein